MSDKHRIDRTTIRYMQPQNQLVVPHYRCRTNKAAFTDEIAAKLFLARTWRRDSKHSKDVKRAYQCQWCGYWHLTSWRSWANGR